MRLFIQSVLTMDSFDLISFTYLWFKYNRIHLIKFRRTSVYM